MAEIIPAIIPASYDDLRNKIGLVKGLVSCVQVDITDGVFVPEKSWPINDEMWGSGIHLDFPFCDICNFELDLMVKNPEERLIDWVAMGASRIVFHIESTSKIKEIINELKGKTAIGLAFDINTLDELYSDIIEKVDFVQLMGIEKIGFQGQPFSEKVLDKIKNLRKRHPSLVISVDGGVSLENAKSLIDAGADRLVVGSAIFGSDDIKGTIGKFKQV